MCDWSDPSDRDAIRPMILLLVADEALREALCFALETDGYAVTAPADMAGCMLCADCRAAACVVIDDGVAPLPPPVAGRPTVILTGDAERFARRGLDDVFLLEKPLLDDALGRELSAVLGRAQSQPGLAIGG